MTAVAEVRRARGVVVTGLLGAVAAVAAVTVVAALAGPFEIPSGGEVIPLPGFAVVTGFFSLVGVVLAVVLRRRPVWFLRITVALTVISLVPPFLVGADAGTALTLVALHLVAAAIMIPVLVRTLR